MQIGSVIGNPLLLHYINCVRDDSVYLRMYYWMAQALREGTEISVCVLKSTDVSTCDGTVLTHCQMVDGALLNTFLSRKLDIMEDVV